MINPKKAYNYFKSTYGLSQSTKGWYALDCPFCLGKKKSAVHFDYELVKCWKCLYRGYLINFVMEIEGLEYASAIMVIDRYEEIDIDFDVLQGIHTDKIVKISLPKTFRTIMAETGTLGIRARRYLLHRKFDINYLDSRGVGFCNDGQYCGYIVVPFKRRNRLYYFVGRSFMNHRIKYLNPKTEEYGIGKSELLFNEDELEINDTIFITEGIFDALTLKNAVAILGLSLSDQQKSKILKSNCAKVVIALDAGYYQQGLDIGVEFINEKETYVLDLQGKIYLRQPWVYPKEIRRALNEILAE